MIVRVTIVKQPHNEMGDPAGGGFAEGGPGQRKEIYTYKAPWTVFSMSWSRRYALVYNCSLTRVSRGSF